MSRSKRKKTGRNYVAKNMPKSGAGPHKDKRKEEEDKRFGQPHYGHEEHE